MVSFSTGVNKGLAKVPMAEIKTRIKGDSLALRVRLPDDSTINVESDTEMEVSELKQIILVPLTTLLLFIPKARLLVSLCCCIPSTPRQGQKLQLNSASFLQNEQKHNPNWMDLPTAALRVFCYG